MKNEFPQGDEQYQDHCIKSVSVGAVTFDDGWSIGIPDDSPIVPAPGMSVRLYGKGIGFQVRGMFIDGRKAYYRTPEEEKEHRGIELYGRDCSDWLQRWDNGKTVWTIEMGGLGPGYEQCIHITMAEILRFILAQKLDASHWTDSEKWKADREIIEKHGFENERVKALGLSGAQWGAAMSLRVTSIRKDRAQS